MGLIKPTVRLRTVFAACACAVLLALAFSGARAADDKTYVMKLGTATINDAQHEWCKRFVAMVEKDSGGRIKGEIYPASQLGPIPREIEGVQFGAIQGYIGPPEFLVGVDHRYEVLSAPGLITDMAHGIRITGDPELQKMMFGLGANKGIRGVALCVSQPSSIVASKPVRHLDDIKGKKLRVLSSRNATGNAKTARRLADCDDARRRTAGDSARRNRRRCARSTVDATMRYYDAAKYITEINQPFIFSMAFLSKKWFDALPDDLQKILDTDAGKAAAEVNPWAADLLQDRERGLEETWRDYQSACRRAGGNDANTRRRRRQRGEKFPRA